MTRGNFFILCVQTYLQKSIAGPEEAVTILDAAAQLPDDAFGTEQIGPCAASFVKWKRHDMIEPVKAKAPEWLAAWHEADHNRVKVSISTAHASHWWGLAQDAYEDSCNGVGVPFPRELAPLLAGRTVQLIVSAQVADEFKVWGASIPGWDEEPFTFEKPQ